MFSRFGDADPFSSSPLPSHLFHPSVSAIGMDFDVSGNDMRELEEQLDSNNESNLGEMYAHTKEYSKDGNQERSREIKSFRSSDGREVTKETKKLGDETLEITRVKEPDESSPKEIANLDGKQLEDFNRRWKDAENDNKLRDERKRLAEGDDDDEDDQDALRNELSIIQDTIE